MTQSIVRYLIVQLLAYLVGHGVITQSIADANTAAMTNYAIIVLSAIGVIAWSFLEKKYKGVLSAYFPSTTSGSTPPSSNALFLLAVAGGGCLLLVFLS